MKNFYGRKKEIERIKRLFEDEVKLGAKLIGIKGRRRVGKSYLVDCFMSKALKASQENSLLILKFVGIKNENSEKNLSICANSLKQQLKQQKDLITLDKFNEFIKYTKYIKTWTDFFFSLKNIITKFDKNVIVFLDEINWFSKKDNFYSSFASAWNSQLVFCQNLTLFFAGSTIGWLNSHFFKNTAEFYGRIDLTIDLKPFSLIEIGKILKNKNKYITEEDIINYYCIFGGIIKYYDLIDFNKSFKDNLTNLFTENKSELLSEKEILFDSLFSLKRSHQDVIKQLSSSKSLTQPDLINKINRKNVYLNILIEDLKELEANNLIKIDDEKYNKSCSIIDLFSYFFYYWFDNNKYKTFSFENSDFRTWKGNALEILIFEQFNEIFPQHENVKINLKTKDLNNIHYQLDLISKNQQEVSFVYEIKNYKDLLEISINDLEFFENKMLSINQKRCEFVLVTLNGSKLLSNIDKQNYQWFNQFCLTNWLEDKLLDR